MSRPVINPRNHKPSAGALQALERVHPTDGFWSELWASMCRARMQAEASEIALLENPEMTDEELNYHYSMVFGIGGDEMRRLKTGRYATVQR